MTKNLLTLTVLVLALVACSPEAPRLTVSPTVAVAGEPVTVTGARFGDRAGSVSLGDEALPAASVAWHADRLVLTPSRRTPSGPLRVTLPGGAALDGPEVQVIGELNALPPAGSTVAPGVTLEAPFRVRLLDTSGRPVAGEAVAFAASDGATLAPSSARTDARGVAVAHLTLPHAPARVELTAGVRCAEPPNACAVRARLTYDTTALEAGALGAPLTFTDGSVRLPGWLELDAQDDGTVARLLTANHRPEAPAGLSPAQAPPAELAAAPAPDLTPTEALVTYRRSPASGGLMTSAAGPGGEETRLVEVPAGADLAAFLERLADDPDVLHVEPNFRVSLAPLPSDPRLHDQWGAFAVGAPAAWHTETGAGSAVVVAIVDSGVDPTHPELAGRLLPGYDFCADDTSDCRASDPDPGAYAFGNWHGTHVAGIVAASAGDGMGVVGVAPDVRLLPVKVFPDAPRGTTTVATLVAAVRWAAGLPVAGVPDNPNPARVINLSLGGEFQSRLLEQALAEVRARGVVVVAAAGNAASAERTVPVEFPAAAPGVIAVGALDPDLTLSPFSNHGAGAWGPDGVDLVAPGRHVISTVPFGWASLSGTSMATPFVSGAAALLLAQEPSRTPDDVERLLKASAYYDPAYMDRSGYGAGLLRVDGALGLPAPTGPADRTVPVQLISPDASAAGELDLLTGTSTLLHLGAVEPATPLLATLQWRGVTLGAQAVVP